MPVSHPTGVGANFQDQRQHHQQTGNRRRRSRNRVLELREEYEDSLGRAAFRFGISGQLDAARQAMLVAQFPALHEEALLLALAQRTLCRAIKFMETNARLNGVSLAENTQPPRTLADHAALQHGLALRKAGAHPENTESRRINGAALLNTPRKRSASRHPSEPFSVAKASQQCLGSKTLPPGPNPQPRTSNSRLNARK